MSDLPPSHHLPEYEAPFLPTPTVQPFTFKDGLSYLQRLERIVKYINQTVVPFVNSSTSTLAEAFQTEVNKLIQEVNDAIDAVIDGSVEIQDPIVAQMIEDTESATRAALDLIFADKTAVDNIMAIITSGRLSESSLDADYAAKSIQTVVESGRLTEANLDASYADKTVETEITSGRLSEATLDAHINDLILDGIDTIDAVDIGASTAKVHIIIAAGQSNMEGRGTPYSSTTDPVNPRIYQYGAQDREIVNATEPLDMVGDLATGIGPSFQFARRMLATLPKEDVIILIPCARGSSALIGSDINSWQWGANAGNLSARAVTQTNEAIADAQVQWPKHEVVVSAILWVQGEQDGNNSVTKSAYEGALTTLINGFRGIYGSTIPFIIGQMVPEGISSGTRNQINEAHSNMPYLLPHVAYALGPVNMQAGDNTHYTSQGQRHLARSMHNQYRRAIGRLAPDTPVQLSSATPGTLMNEMFVQQGIATVTNPGTAAATIAVTFPVPFGTTPVVVAQTNIDSSGNMVDAYAASPTVNGFTLRYKASTAITGTRDIYWIASGPKLEG